MKSLSFLGLFALAAAALYGQPTNGPVYWSTVPPDCSSLAGQAPVKIKSGTTTIGYSCYVSGAFPWFAAGGGWGTSIRVAAPASAPVGVDYTFYDKSGNILSVDTAFGSGSLTRSSNDVNFALSANQPAEVVVLGATNSAPQYSSTATGSVYAVIYCPDATTCSNVLPQLLYSALPANPWSLSVPIAWDTELWTQWSAEGIDDGSAHRVSLVIYNEDMSAANYTVRIYDSKGSLAGTGTTPLIPPLQPLGNGTLGQGGTYAALLSDLISTPLPSGVFKIVVDGGSRYSAVDVFQFNGPSATALAVTYDSAAGLSPKTAAALRMNARTARVESMLKPLFSR